MAHNVATGSFCKDNYARRQLKNVASSVADAVEEVENISAIITPTLAKYKLVGTYTLPVDTSMPEAGLRASDFGVTSMEGVKGVVITINGIHAPTADAFFNKSIRFTVEDGDGNALFNIYDNNETVSFEYFNCVVAPYALAYCKLSGRAPTADTVSLRTGFYHMEHGLNSGEMFTTETKIADVNVRFGTNEYTQVTPIVFRMYLQY